MGIVGEIMKANLFGDVRAEHDHEMLNTSFHESQNYRTLIESRDRFIVVGRRGTGKSALTYKLSKDWKLKKFGVLVIAPSEEHVIGLRPVASLFGDSVSRIRAGVKLAWKYALIMEIASSFEKNYKISSEMVNYPKLKAHLKKWNSSGSNLFEKLRVTLIESLRSITNPEDRIADISKLLELNQLTQELTEINNHSKHDFVLLIDKLDEGYEPDTVGIGIIDGIIYGTDEIRNAVDQHFQAIVFLRDNIFRAVQVEDKDFSRNLEGQILRLHWDPEELFYMACKRIRIAFNIEKESDVKVWNAITENELHGREGFKKCLRFTLYRPRDVISLLNTAIEQARRQNREMLTEEDFLTSAKQISLIRFDDLRKEYAHVFPGIEQLTNAFNNSLTQFSVEHARQKIKFVVDNLKNQPEVLQHLRILGSEEEITKALYGIGFWGIFDTQNQTWIFSHDGKQPNKSINGEDSLMIHPCYWNALNLQNDNLEQSIAEQIFDEYEITIHSQTAEQRSTRLGQLISELSKIPLGNEGATDFENWCKLVIEIAFAKELTNIQLHPNGQAVQRRDIVATNQGIHGFWKRIREDYETRQVIFEVKNFEEIGIDEYRQVNGYLTREYGNLGFIICRDKQGGLVKGRELEAFREFYLQRKVILKLTASGLISVLSKLRSPTKTDAGEQLLNSMLDTHIRMYASGQLESKSSKRKK